MKTRFLKGLTILAFATVSSSIFADAVFFGEGDGHAATETAETAEVAEVEPAPQQETEEPSAITEEQETALSQMYQEYQESREQAETAETSHNGISQFSEKRPVNSECRYRNGRRFECRGGASNNGSISRGDGNIDQNFQRPRPSNGEIAVTVLSLGSHLSTLNRLEADDYTLEDLKYLALVRAKFDVVFNKLRKQKMDGATQIFPDGHGIAQGEKPPVINNKPDEHGRILKDQEIQGDVCVVNNENEEEQCGAVTWVKKIHTQGQQQPIALEDGEDLGVVVDHLQRLIPNDSALAASADEDNVGTSDYVIGEGVN